MVAPIKQTNVTTSVRVDANGAQYVQLSWTFNGNYDATYRVYKDSKQIGVANAPSRDLSPGTLSYRDTHLTPSTEPFYTVAAVVGTTVGPLSDPVSAIIPAAPPAAPSEVKGAANFNLNAATPTPYITLTWRNDINNAYYNIYKNGVLLTAVGALSNESTPYNGYRDDAVTVGGLYTYSIQAGVGNSLVGPGTNVTVPVPLYPAEFTPAVPDSTVGGVVKWTFTDVYQKGPTPYTYTWAINPNDGGSPTFEKTVTPMKVTGPNQMPLIQEGSPGVSTMSFSGIILSQAQLETMELWFRKRILIEVTDDLHRRFYGVFSVWTPQRSRRSSNFWYHTYQAQITILAYYNASGQRVFGRFL